MEKDGSHSLRCCIFSCRFWLAFLSCCSLVAAFWAFRTWKTRSSSCTSCRSEENLPSSTSTSFSSSLRRKTDWVRWTRTEQDWWCVRGSPLMFPHRWYKPSSNSNRSVFNTPNDCLITPSPDHPHNTLRAPSIKRSTCSWKWWTLFRIISKDI